MNTRKAILLGVAVVFVGVVAVQAWRWRQPVTKPPDPTQQAVSVMADKAYKEIQTIKKSGGKPDAIDEAAKRWADTAWRYREEHPKTPGAKMATSLALQMLAEMSSRDELLNRAKTLPANDEAVSFIIYLLYRRAESKKDLPAFIAFAEDLRERRNGNQPEDVTMRSRLDYHIGLAYDALHNASQARAAFERAIQEAPASLWARDSKLGIYELEHLSRGQPAPRFAGTDLDGKPIALANLRGRTVLLDFWGKG